VYRSELLELKGVEANTLYRVDLRYSYKPTDELLGALLFGQYTEDFYSREEAQIALTSLTSRRLFVRYNPMKAAEYFMDPYKDF
jgi:hypothetical protein